MRFAGRAALVTGASTGIGRATALRLARDGANLCVVAMDDDADDLHAVAEEARTAGVDAFALVGDVAEQDTARTAVGQVLERFGRLDLLACIAGIAHFEPALDAPIEHLDREWEVNVRGHYLFATEAARAMRTGPAGAAIVCTASTASWMGEEYQVTYNVTKGAVASLARSLGVDLAPFGIRVNAVAPGFVRARTTAFMLDDPASWAKSRARIAMDRMAEPEEIANVMTFLLSDEASYMTGSLVVVDGGMTAGFRNSDWEAVPGAIEPRRP